MSELNGFRLTEARIGFNEVPEELKKYMEQEDALSAQEILDQLKQMKNQ